MNSETTPSASLIVAILIPDRVGVIADTTGVVFELGGNIEGIRQSVVGGFFSLTFTATFPGADGEAVGKAVEGRLRPVLGVSASIVIRPFRKTPAPVLPDGDRFIAITHGKDRPGTIHAISSFFVGHGVNIVSWNVDIKPDEVLYVATVIIPAGKDTREVQRDFVEAMAARGVKAALAHENIFRATNEVGPIGTLLTRGAGGRGAKPAAGGQAPC